MRESHIKLFRRGNHYVFVNYKSIQAYKDKWFPQFPQKVKENHLFDFLTKAFPQNFYTNNHTLQDYQFMHFLIDGFIFQGIANKTLTKDNPISINIYLKADIPYGFFKKTSITRLDFCIYLKQKLTELAVDKASFEHLADCYIKETSFFVEDEDLPELTKSGYVLEQIV